MAFTAHGATVTFSSHRGSYTALATNVSVTPPEAEIVDISTSNAGPRRVISTGDFVSGSGSIVVSYNQGNSSPLNLVGGQGTLSFSAPTWSFSYSVVLKSVSEEGGVGAVSSGTLNFVIQSINVFSQA